MSPRRRIDPVAEAAEAAEAVDELPDYERANPIRRWWASRGEWAVPMAGAIAVVLVVATITAGSLILANHEQHRRAALRDAEVLGFARSFMTEYATLDPFNANDYAERILEQATGEFKQAYAQRINEVVVQVAQGEPTSGAVLAAGIEKRYENGSVSVLIAVKATTALPDGTGVLEDGSRWVATAVKEGQQWKISRLTHVI